MKKSLNSDSRGLAVVAVALVVLVVVALGGVGYFVYSKQKSQGGSGDGSNALTNALKQAAAKCEYDDKDLCKFFASWKDQKYYNLTSESMSEGIVLKSTYKFVAPDKTHITNISEPVSEMIIIGDTTYTKDMADGKWWKQTQKKEVTDKYTANENFDFKEPEKDKPVEQQTQYKNLGKEKCGALDCFKYQVIELSNKDATELVWFDTKDYQLRRSRTEEKNGNYTDSTFSYDKVEIKEPSPVKELAPNQVVVPGQTEPMTMPSEADMQNLMNQAGQDSQQQ